MPSQKEKKSKCMEGNKKKKGHTYGRYIFSLIPP